MGCRTSRATSGIHKEPEVSTASKSNMFTSRTQLLDPASSSQAWEASRSKLRALITSANILSIVQATEASVLQLQFLEAWLETVFEKALPSAAIGGRRFIISTDMTYMEVRIKGPVGLMTELSGRFLREAFPGMEGRTAIMTDLVKDAKAEEVALWARLKRMGSRWPSVDTGFTVDGPVEWMVADLLMPATPDQDWLRAHAVQERLSPCSYGGSLIPVEPETFLDFEMVLGVHKKLLLPGLFFFKRLGFVKPEDNVIGALNSCQPSRCNTSVCMGPQGLTRLVLRLRDLVSPMAQEIAACVRCKYAQEVNSVPNQLDAEADLIDFFADAQGFGVAMGFTA